MRILTSENEHFWRFVRPLGSKRYRHGYEKLQEAGCGALLVAKHPMEGIDAGDVLVARCGYQPYRTKRINLLDTEPEDWVEFIRRVWYL